MRRSLADRLVVAVKRLLAGVGVERRGRLIRNVDSINRGVALGGSEDGHAKVAGQAVCDSQADGLGGVAAGQGQQGRPGRGRAGARGVRGRSEEQPLQDLESDEFGVLLSAPGQGGGDPQAAWRRGPRARRADGRRQGRADGRGHASGARVEPSVSPGLLWLPAGQVGSGRGRGMPGAVLEVRLGDRSGRPEVLRQVPWDLVVKAVEAVTDCRWVLLYVKRWLAAPLQHPDGTLERARQGNPAGVGGLAVLANLFMHYAFDTWMARDFPGCPFERYADDAVVHCVSEAAGRGVLAAIAARMQRGRAAAAPGQDADRLLQGRQAPGQARAHLVYLPRVHLPGTGAREQGRRGSSPAFLPAISTEALKAKSAELRAMRIHRRTDLSLDDLARWLNPIVAGWMQLLRPVLPVGAVPLLRRVNAYLRRWAGKKYRRLRTYKQVQAVVDRALARASRPVRPLALGPRVLMTRMRRAR